MLAKRSSKGATKIELITEKRGDCDFRTPTSGLSTVGQLEIQANVADPVLVAESENFLRYVAHYVTTSKRHIHPDETLAYGYWLVKFQGADENTLETWEYAPDGSDFVKGANLTLRYWRDQHEICKLYNAEFTPPRPDRLGLFRMEFWKVCPLRGYDILHLTTCLDGGSLRTNTTETAKLCAANTLIM